MYNTMVQKLLEDFNIYPRASANVVNGPNIDFRGPTPAGFLGGGLPGINPASTSFVAKRKKKLRRKRRIKS
jgi:hypothetical protein